MYVFSVDFLQLQKLPLQVNLSPHRCIAKTEVAFAWGNHSNSKTLERIHFRSVSHGTLKINKDGYYEFVKYLYKCYYQYQYYTIVWKIFKKNWLRKTILNIENYFLSQPLKLIE